MKPGDRARFFDPLSDWRCTGDVDDNDIYFLPATVVKVYHKMWQSASGPQKQELVDIVFDHRPTIVSKGHFTSRTKSV